MQPPTRRRRVLRALPAIGYAALILALSSRPGADLPPEALEIGDEVLHFFEYLVFGVLLLFAARGFVRRFRILALAAGVAFAALDEAFQTLVPGRFGEATDFAMDVLGLFGALLLDLITDPASARPKDA